MASTPLPGYSEELRQHSPHNKAVVRRSGTGVTLYCVCNRRVLTSVEEISLDDLLQAVADHARFHAEKAVQ